MLPYMFNQPPPEIIEKEKKKPKKAVPFQLDDTYDDGPFDQDDMTMLSNFANDIRR